MMFCDICQIDNVDMSIGIINKLTVNRYLIFNKRYYANSVVRCLLTLKKVIVIVKSHGNFIIFAGYCKHIRKC